MLPLLTTRMTRSAMRTSASCRSSKTTATACSSTPLVALEAEQMATFQAALKRSIQAEFQLEDQELAAEPLPTADARNVLLFFEAAEGGAGVLRRLIEDQEAIARVAAAALELCHFAPDSERTSSAPSTRARTARSLATTACFTTAISATTVFFDRTADPRPIARSRRGEDCVRRQSRRATTTQHFSNAAATQTSSAACIDLLVAERRRLPDEPQKLIAAAQTRPDFIYKDAQVAVFVDGPHP